MNIGITEVERIINFQATTDGGAGSEGGGNDKCIFYLPQLICRNDSSPYGDAQIFFETANYLFDYAAFSRKYLNDVYDWQKKDGRLPQIAPYGGVDFYMWTMNGSVGWSDAGILIPYRFWKLYGDKQILIEYYDRMKRYAGFMMNRCGKLGLMAKPLGLKGEAAKYAVNAGQSYGEWAEPKDVYPNDWKDMVAPHPEVSTAYTSYVRYQGGW